MVRLFTCGNVLKYTPAQRNISIVAKHEAHNIIYYLYIYTLIYYTIV